MVGLQNVNHQAFKFIRFDLIGVFESIQCILDVVVENKLGIHDVNLFFVIRELQLLKLLDHLFEVI